MHIPCICPSVTCVFDYSHERCGLPLTQSFIALHNITTLQPSLKGEWLQWSNKVPKVDIETHKVAAPDVVIPTVDTIRHECLLYTWLAEHKPMLLCGPPGSGKTMTLFSALRSLPDLEVLYSYSIEI